MWPYWLVSIAVAMVALKGRYYQVKYCRGPVLQQGFLWHLVLLVLTLFIGLRYEVGGDWIAYLDHLDSLRGETLASGVGSTDPAYGLMAWFGANVWGNIYFVNTVCALIFSWGLLVFCREQPRPFLALMVALPFFVLVVAMGYTRQSAAISLGMIALTSLSQSRIYRFIFFVGLATLFHKTALVLFSFALILRSKNQLLSVAVIFGSAVLLYDFFLQEYTASLFGGYIEAQYHSSGGATRLLMNALPAAFFLLFRRQFKLSGSNCRLWTWVAVTALALLSLLFVVPSTTALDRIGLYWAPLQIFVLSRVPDVIGRGAEKKILVLFVIVYSLSVQFVWFFFADHAFAWLPYRFWPLELLRS